LSLHAHLAARAADRRPIRVGLVGAGKFGTMFLAQARNLAGIHVAAVADAEIEHGHTALALAAWPPLKAVARSLSHALESGGTFVTDDAPGLIDEGRLDVVVDATGNTLAAVRHALAAIAAGAHVVMATVEADALCGPLLARRAEAAGVVYSLAYGDQPALVCTLVDWARSCGFEVAAAGKGAKYLPGYNATTDDTVWQHYGLTPDRARAAGMNARRFTSFIDGTKSAVEMAAVANATGLAPPSIGLSHMPCGVHDLPRLMKPKWDGGRLEAMGQVEVVSSEERDGRHVAGDLRRGVFVTFRAQTDYAARCFAEYGAITDETGNYAALWRPSHLVGLELGRTIAAVGCLGQATGSPVEFTADVVAIAKRDLSAGTELDGEGGHTVWGKLLPAAAAVALHALPIGLTPGAVLTRPVAANQTITWDDVTLGDVGDVADLRRDMEREFAT
jgi:predicted homoserine dehydrogenase-like protein